MSSDQADQVIMLLWLIAVLLAFIFAAIVIHSTGSARRR